MNEDQLFKEFQQRRGYFESLAKDNPDFQTVLDMADFCQQAIQQRDEIIAEKNSIIEELKRQLFGSRGEKLTPEEEAQLAEAVDALQEELEGPLADSQQCLEEEVPESKDKPKRRGGRHPLPEHLEEQTQVLEPAQRNCPCCQRPYRKIRDEVSVKMDYVPAKLIKQRTVRPQYAPDCGCAQAQMSIAALPTEILPGSQLGLGLAVFILLSKYDDHLALYTLERIFRERHGVVITRQQMVRWIEHLAGLLRLLVDRMWEPMKAGGYLQIDETPVKVLDPEVKGKAPRGYLWFYGVPRGDVVLEFSMTRGQDPPKKRLQGFVGVFQSDDFSSYGCVVRDIAGARRIGCNAHARRYFYNALLEGDRQALWFLQEYRKLYRIEAKSRALSLEERHALRQQSAPEIFAGMKLRAEELKPTFLPKSSMGKAVNYFLNDYEPLQAYLAEGHLEIDNNLIENPIRGPAVGRKRWLFLGHPDAGWRSAVIYSLLISCRRRGINPQQYLTDVLRRLPGLTNQQLDPLLPANWKPPLP
jgi:transposase